MKRDWKGWTRTLLLEGLDPTLDLDVVVERESEATSIGRGLEGLDPDVVDGRVGSGRTSIGLLLIVPIDAVVANCSDRCRRRCCC